MSYNPEDEPRPGRFIELDEDDLQTLVEQNAIATVEDEAEKSAFVQSIIHCHLLSVGHY